MSHRVTRLWPMLAGVLLAATACTDSPPSGPDGAAAELGTETRSIEAPAMASVLNSAPALEVCGPEVKYTFVAGRYTPGTVRVSNDATHLYVSYATSGEWYVSDTRLAVTKSLDEIPLDKKRRVNPWRFPYSAEHEPPVQAYTYAVPLASIGARAGDKLVVAAWAGVVHPVQPGDREGRWEWITGWGIGAISGTSLSNLSNYTVAACPDAPPPPPPAQGIVSITFDDGWAEHYTRAFPILQAAGIRANVAVNPVPIDGRYAGYMRLEHLRELHDAGWAVVSHSMTHKRLTDATDAELEYELGESQAWMQRHGFRGSQVFVVPFHAWGERERAAVAKYYHGARGRSATQFNPPKLTPVPIADYYKLTSYEPSLSAFDEAQMRMFLDRAVSQSQQVDILVHKIPADRVAAFQRVVDVLDDYKPYIRTYDQIVP